MTRHPLPLAGHPSADSTSPLLVAHSYYLGYDPKQVKKMKPYPPLGTLLAAARLREAGFEVSFFDAMLSRGTGAFADLVDRVEPPIVGLFEDNFNFLTKMCTVRMREAALEMIRVARASGARVAVNGSDATDRPELYLRAGADAVIVGEVEETALLLFGRWAADPDAPLGDLPGLVLRGDSEGGTQPGGGVRRTAPPPKIHDLDALPLPAWDLLDVEAYRRAWSGAHGRLSWNVVTSRGCPYGCNWCAKPVFGRRYVQRSPASVAEEIRALLDAVGPDHLWFADDIFGLTADWIEAFAEEVERRDAVVPFMMQSRVNLMTPRTARALRRAGCEEVWMGVESGSQKILDAMDKGSTVDQARQATRHLRSEGIRSCWFVQLGYLGEEWEDIVSTRDLLREERPDDVGVSVSYPLPGTEFHDRVRAQLGPKRNWNDSDELAMMFQGTYTTPFYRKVRALLHDEVRNGSGSDAGANLDACWSELEREQDRYRSERPTRV